MKLKYKTYIFPDVFTDYTSGIAVVRARTEKEALKLVLDYEGITQDDIDKNQCYSYDLVRTKPYVLKDGDVVTVYGGG